MLCLNIAAVMMNTQWKQQRSISELKTVLFTSPHHHTLTTLTHTTIITTLTPSHPHTLTPSPCSDGLCRGCGQQLENGHLSAAEVEELLCHVNHILYAEANTFLDNRLFLREQALLRNLIAEVGPITAVVDGLNAAHVKTQKIFSYNQV